MSHRHSFNTQPRVRVRQKAALERWEDRIKLCGQMINNPDHHRESWEHNLALAHEQRDILKRKLGY